jgi:TolA-binding protein
MASMGQISSGVVGNAYAADDEEMTAEDFKDKLTEMFTRINKSLKILRDQITANQSAPFLANLYMQLGDMLSQKANVLYYIKMEGSQDSDTAQASDGQEEKKFKDVIDATKESISIYEKVIKEFPKFVGRPRALYQAALALKSIDEPVRFLETTNDLIKSYPGTKDAVKGELLLGQHIFEKGIFDEALKRYLPVSKVSYPYERNQAKYKMALIKITEEKHKEALDLFVEVITDKDFKNEDNEAEVNLKKKSLKTDLKREALVDSVRAFTEVYPDGGEPVVFYSNIAPTENLFQETIEKLAFRYINLKQYGNAIKLLRTLSERTASPEKVLTIYKEVLLMIPLNDRVSLPSSEIRYVFEKYIQWITFYKLSADVKKSADDFFEKQLRDLGTRSHEMGKTEKNPEKARMYLKNSLEFYELYLAVYSKNVYAIKMALNSGDAYFRLGDFLKCGDFYLRSYKMEFGKITQKDKGPVLKNAVYCLQKEKEYSFYELRRIKGLLIESLKLLMELDPVKKQDPKTNFALAKAIYDQGFYQPAMAKLLEFMKKFPNTSFAVDSANLILDYYNIKSDFQGLMDWGGKILALNLPNKELNEKVKTIREQAKYKKLQAQVETSDSFDGFAQGKSYLANAANIQNVELRNLALSKALEASKREKDLDTFFKAATSIASKESDAGKKAEIELSMSQEHVKMGNFLTAKNFYTKILSSSAPPASKQLAFSSLLTMSMALRDWDTLAQLVGNSNWSSAPDAAKQQLKDLAGNALESPIPISASMVKVMKSIGSSPNLALGMWKAQSRLPSGLSGLKSSMIDSTCSSGPSAAVCKWQSLAQADRQSKVVINSMNSASGDLTQMEQIANQFAGSTQSYSSLEGSSDAAIDVISSLRQSELYAKFAQYLKKVAAANAQIAQMINAKSQETLKTAKAFQERCQKIISSAALYSPVNKYCMQGKSPSIAEAMSWSTQVSSPETKHVAEKDLSAEKKDVFANYDGERILKLAKAFWDKGAYHYSAAASVYGLGLGVSSGDFKAILGCSTMQLGYLSEAQFYLQSATDYQGLKSKCMTRVKGMLQ